MTDALESHMTDAQMMCGKTKLKWFRSTHSSSFYMGSLYSDTFRNQFSREFEEWLLKFNRIFNVNLRIGLQFIFYSLTFGFNQKKKRKKKKMFT